MSIIDLIQIMHFVEIVLNDGKQFIFLVAESFELYHHHEFDEFFLVL